MSVTVEEIAPCRRRLRIEVPLNEVAAEIDRITDQFQKMAKIPGFRTGKVPKNIIAKHFEKEIDEETQRKLLSKAYKQAIADKKLRVVSQPAIEEVNFKRGFSFSFSTVVDLAPEFPLPDYKGIPIPTQNSELTEEEFDTQLNQLLDRYAEFSDIVDRVIQKGDYAVISHHAVCEGKPLAEVEPSAKNLAAQDNLWLLIDEQSYLPGFASQLLGLKPEDKKEVQVDFPKDFPYPSLSGKKAAFFVEIKAIKLKQVPTLDDTLAQKIAHLPAEQFREQFRKDLQTAKNNQLLHQQKEKLVDYLINKTNFDLPESVVSAQTRSAVREIVNENHARGVSAETLELKKNEIFQIASRNARDRVKAAYILIRIAEQEKIEVTPEEMHQRIASLARQYDIAFEKLLAGLEQHNGIGQIEEELLVSKTLDFLLNHAKLEKI